jgi:hypothetical protein
MASTNLSGNGQMPSGDGPTNGGATARAVHPVDAEDEPLVEPSELMSPSTETLTSGNGKPIRQDYSVELIQRDKSAGPAYRRLLTPEEVAERLNVSPDWVRDHSSRKTPRLPVIRLGGGPGRAGLLRYRASDIERFIEDMARLSEPRAKRAV